MKSRTRTTLRTLVGAAALLAAGQASADGFAWWFNNAADIDSFYLEVAPADSGIVDLGITRTYSDYGSGWQINDWTASHPRGSVETDVDRRGNTIPVSDAILMEGAAVLSGDFYLLAHIDIADRSTNFLLNYRTSLGGVVRTQGSMQWNGRTFTSVAPSPVPIPGSLGLTLSALAVLGLRKTGLSELLLTGPARSGAAA